MEQSATRRAFPHRDEARGEQATAPDPGPAAAIASLAQLHQAEERYRAIAEVVADWAYSLRIEPDSTIKVVWTNLDVVRITGFQGSDLDADRSWLDLVHADDRVTVRDHLDGLLAGRTDVAEYRIRTRTGEVRWLRDHARPLKERESGGMEVVGGVRDITTRRQAEEDRARLISELETTNEELERLAVSVSRQLDEPLTAVASSLEELDTHLVRSGEASALRETVMRTRTGIERLGDILESLDEMSRIGHLPQTLEMVALSDLATQAVDLCRDRIDSQGVTVEIGSLPEVFGDRIRLLQLLRILVDNAVRYMGNQADPSLQIDSQERPGRRILYVRDNGAGIDPGDLERVFDMFRRVDPRGPGLGVGLALARRIAQMHGGRIRAESEGRNRGATFFVELPA